MRTPCHWVTEQGDINLLLPRKLYPLQANFHSAGRCCSLYQKNSANPFCDNEHRNKDCSQKYALWSHSGMNIIALTKYFLIGFKSHFLKWNLYLAPLLDVASQATVAPTEKPVMVIILCGYTIKLIFNDLALCQ